MDESMSITPNPLRWPPGMPIDQPYYKGPESNLARQRIPAMRSQPVGINPRNRGRGRGINTMEQYAGPQGRPSLPHQGVPEEPRIRATEAFLRGLVPGPLDEYPGPLATPGFPVAAYPQSIPTIPPPGGPYIRPAVAEDAEEIVPLINWYSTTSPLDSERGELKHAEEIHDFLETCKVRKLPFLVLICSSEMTQKMMGPPTFKIFGVAYIDVLYGVATENSIGDLHIYVRPGYTKKGFGSMLVDCILSICDEYYRRRYAYEWQPLGPVELHVLRLKQLMCNISYPAQLEGKYSWIRQWLKNRFGFMNFGQMRQDRAKNGHEDSYSCLHLPINSGRKPLLLEAPQINH